MAVISNAELKTLQEARTRKRFTDEQIEVALKFMVDNPTTSVQDVAAKHGMTPQTLNARKKQLMQKRGIATEAEKKPAAKKK